MSEDRLRELLEAATPDFDPLDLDLTPRRRRPWAAVAAASSVIAAVALVVVVVRNGSHATRPAAASGDPSPTATAPALDLAALTADIPCDAPLHDRVPPERLDALHPVALFLCGSREQTYPDGEWTMRTREATVPDDMAAIVRVLQAPLPPRPSGAVACAGVGYPSIGVTFVAANGDYLVPQDRRTYCGVPIGLHALDGVKFTELSATKVRLQRSAASIDANCEARFKGPELLGIDRNNPPTTTGVFADASQATLRACVYGPGDDPDVGDFVRGVTLDDAQTAQLREALAGPAPDGSCESQPDFAVVLAAGRFVEVELGGCYRVLREDYTVGTADAAVIDELLGRS